MNIKKLFNKGERGTHIEMRTVKRGGKTFKRKTRVGTKEPEKVDIPKMSDMKFNMIAEGIKENIEYQGKNKISEMDDDDIRTYIEDFTPEEYDYKLGTGKLRDEFIERSLKEFKEKYLNIKEIPTREEFYSQEYWHDPKRGQHPASGSGRLPTKDVAQIEIKNIGGEPAIRIYNPWTKEEIYYYDLDQMDEAKERFKNLYDETFGDSKNIVKEGNNKKLVSQYLAGIEYSVRHLKKLETIDIMKLMRGTHKEKVPVKRETGTKYEYRRVGKKESPRKGTGKMDRFPEAIKKEILEQRSYGESGAKIKGIVENLIDTMSTNDQMKMETLGLIDDKNKLTVTAQALTDWSKKQGVESTKKRISAVDAERVKHEDTKKELGRADKKIARLEIAASHNLEEIRLVQKDKMEVDRIRQEQRKDIRSLTEKLKSCLSGNKK